jgi:hypothetical protein
MKSSNIGVWESIHLPLGFVEPLDRNEMITFGLISGFNAETRMLSNTRGNTPGYWDASV